MIRSQNFEFENSCVDVPAGHIMLMGYTIRVAAARNATRAAAAFANAAVAAAAARGGGPAAIAAAHRDAPHANSARWKSGWRYTAWLHWVHATDEVNRGCAHSVAFWHHIPVGLHRRAAVCSLSLARCRRLSCDFLWPLARWSEYNRCIPSSPVDNLAPN